MKLDVIVYLGGRNALRGDILGRAMASGIQRSGDKVSFRKACIDGVHGDIAVFYGLGPSMSKTFANYIDAGKHVVFIDLGYWQRKYAGHRYTGHHRISIDHRHPSEAQVMRLDMPSDRFNKMNINIQPWRKDGRGNILLAGMSRKGAESYGFSYQEWERKALKRMKSSGVKTLVIYRPKPARSDPQIPLLGTKFSDAREKLDRVLDKTFAVVTHHSNVAIDGIIRGVPCFCDEGIAMPMAGGGSRKVLTPIYPDDKTRSKWLNNVAYFQWTPDEMSKGKPWNWLKDNNFLS